MAHRPGDDLVEAVGVGGVEGPPAVDVGRLVEVDAGLPAAVDGGELEPAGAARLFDAAAGEHHAPDRQADRLDLVGERLVLVGRHEGVDHRDPVDVDHDPRIGSSPPGGPCSQARTPGARGARGTGAEASGRRHARRSGAVDATSRSTLAGGQAQIALGRGSPELRRAGAGGLEADDDNERARRTRAPAPPGAHDPRRTGGLTAWHVPPPAPSDRWPCSSCSPAHPDERFTLSEVARRCELNKATAHALLSALSERGVLLRHPAEKRYSLGPVLVSIGEAARRGYTASDFVGPTLDDLAAQTGLWVRAWHADGDHIGWSPSRAGRALPAGGAIRLPLIPPSVRSEWRSPIPPPSRPGWHGPRRASAPGGGRRAAGDPPSRASSSSAPTPSGGS